ncbi:MAG: hypothetical protein L0Y39_09865 [Methylococcaceae bacterium]|nr:hypothetical protein [Methylococcaceae bacterium]
MPASQNTAFSSLSGTNSLSLSVIVGLATALQRGLTEKRRRGLIEVLEIAPQTMVRWRRLWREVFPQSRFWQAQRGGLLAPWAIRHLPGGLVERFNGATLADRLGQLLVWIGPVTSASSRLLRVAADPQKMRS